MKIHITLWTVQNMSSVTFVLIMIKLSWIDSNDDFKERCQCQREWRKSNRSNASTQICT